MAKKVKRIQRAAQQRDKSDNGKDDSKEKADLKLPTPQTQNTDAPKQQDEAQKNEVTQVTTSELSAAVSQSSAEPSPPSLASSLQNVVSSLLNMLTIIINQVEQYLTEGRTVGKYTVEAQLISLGQVYAKLGMTNKAKPILDRVSKSLSFIEDPFRFG